jgi:hypothetical protein
MYFVNQTIINGVAVEGGDDCLFSPAGWLIIWNNEFIRRTKLLKIFLGYILSYISRPS